MAKKRISDTERLNYWIANPGEFVEGHDWFSNTPTREALDSSILYQRMLAAEKEKRRLARRPASRKKNGGRK